MTTQDLELKKFEKISTVPIVGFFALLPTRIKFYKEAKQNSSYDNILFRQQLEHNLKNIKVLRLKFELAEAIQGNDIKKKIHLKDELLSQKLNPDLKSWLYNFEPTDFLESAQSELLMRSMLEVDLQH